MKRVVTVLLAISLYAPHIAKILAYTDCTIQKINGEASTVCDCNNIIVSDGLPVYPEKTNKQKEIIAKYDWKYTGKGNFSLYHFKILSAFKGLIRGCLFIPNPIRKEIFHPPQQPSLFEFILTKSILL